MQVFCARGRTRSRPLLISAANRLVNLSSALRFVYTHRLHFFRVTFFVYCVFVQVNTKMYSSHFYLCSWRNKSDDEMLQRFSTRHLQHIHVPTFVRQVLWFSTHKYFGWGWTRDFSIVCALDRVCFSQPILRITPLNLGMFYVCLFCAVSLIKTTN